jgi:hypothetical protein
VLQHVGAWRTEADNHHQLQLDEVDDEVGRLKTAIEDLQRQLTALADFRAELIDKHERLDAEQAQRAHEGIFERLHTDADALEPITTDPPPPFAPPPPAADDSMDPAVRPRPPEPTMLVERTRARAAATEVVVRAVAPVRDGPGRNESITPVFEGEEATLAVSARSPLDARGQSVTVRGAPPTSGVEPPRILAHGDDVATQAEIVLRPTEPRSSVRVTAPDDSDDNTEAYDETDEAPEVSPREPTRIERPVLVRRPEPTRVSDRLVGTVPAATARAPRPPARARPTESPLPASRKDGAWWSRRPLLALLVVFVLGAGTGVALTAMLRRADEPAVVTEQVDQPPPPPFASGPCGDRCRIAQWIHHRHQPPSRDPPAVPHLGRGQDRGGAAQPREVPGLRRRHQRDGGPGSGVVEAGEGHVPRAAMLLVEQQVRPDLVADHGDPVGHRELREPQQIGVAKHRAGGVVWMTEPEEF